jgi:hypothetical protein
VIPATDVELCVAIRTLVPALHVFPYGQFGAASPAENRFPLPLAFGPHFNRMICQRFMAIFAGVIDPATSHLDRNNIHRPVVVATSRLWIKIEPSYLRRIIAHSIHPKTAANPHAAFPDHRGAMTLERPQSQLSLTHAAAQKHHSICNDGEGVHREPLSHPLAGNS